MLDNDTLEITPAGNINGEVVEHMGGLADAFMAYHANVDEVDLPYFFIDISNVDLPNAEARKAAYHIWRRYADKSISIHIGAPPLVTSMVALMTPLLPKLRLYTVPTLEEALDIRDRLRLGNRSAIAPPEPLDIGNPTEVVHDWLEIGDRRLPSITRSEWSWISNDGSRVIQMSIVDGRFVYILQQGRLDLESAQALKDLLLEAHQFFGAHSELFILINHRKGDRVTAEARKFIWDLHHERPDLFRCLSLVVGPVVSLVARTMKSLRPTAMKDLYVSTTLEEGYSHVQDCYDEKLAPQAELTSTKSGSAARPLDPANISSRIDPATLEEGDRHQLLRDILGQMLWNRNEDHDIPQLDEDDPFHQIFKAVELLKQDTRQLVEEIDHGAAQRVELERELHKTKQLQALQTLSAGLGQEFNNLLWTIQGHLEAAARALPDNSQLDPHLDAISGATAIGARLLTQLNDFSNSSRVDHRKVDLGLLIRQSIRSIKGMMDKELNLDVQIDDDHGQLIVFGDSQKLAQVVLNLAGNAIQAMDEGGDLTISLKASTETSPNHPQGAIMLTVSDTGSGLDEATRSRIFEPFFSTKDDPTSTGLGLSTVQGIITKMDGRIEVDSRMGEGTTFRIFLPPVHSEGRDEASSEESRVRPVILLVSDVGHLVDMLSVQMESVDCDSVHALNIDEAKRLVGDTNQSVAAVIVDEVVGGNSGLQVIQALKEINPDAPTILQTSYGTAVTSEPTIPEGVDALLPKPTRVNKLREILSSLTTSSRPRSE